jgi:hypothetical protein
VVSTVQCYTHVDIPSDWFQHNAVHGPVNCNNGTDTLVISLLDSSAGFHIYVGNGYRSTFFAFDESGNEVPGCGQYPPVVATYENQEFWSIDWAECQTHFDQIRSYDVYGF